MIDSDKKAPADLAGAYALNALDAADIATFEAHLAESEQARVEAAQLSDAAVALSLAITPVEPSAGLKASLMARLATTPQLPPLPVAVAPERENSPVAPLTAATPLDGAGPSPSAAESPASTRTSASDKAQARWFQRPARVMLAAAAAVALFVGGAFIGDSFTSNDFVDQQASSLAQINAAADSQRASTTTSDGQDATLVWSNSLGLSAFLVDNLPALSDNEDYQLWYMNDAGAVGAGTFDSTGEGTVWRVLDGKMHVGDQVGVTVEPNGGSDQPTSEPIIAFQS